MLFISEPNGRHDFVSIFIIPSIVYYIIYTIGLILGPRHIFVPHPRHEHVTMYLWSGTANVVVISAGEIVTAAVSSLIK